METELNLLNGLATRWERLSEKQREREIELINQGDKVLATAVSMVADTYEYCTKELREEMRTIKNHQNHMEMCKNLVKMKLK